MKNQKLVVLAVVVSLFTWIGCSTENLNEETPVEAVEGQDPFITKHQAIFDVIVADDVITDAEFATLTKLEGFAVFNEALMQELDEIINTTVDGVGSKITTKAQREACRKRARNTYNKKKIVCNTRKIKKNRAGCKAKALRTFVTVDRLCIGGN